MEKIHFTQPGVTFNDCRGTSCSQMRTCTTTLAMQKITMNMLVTVQYVIYVHI